MTFALTATRSVHLRPGRWTPKELGTLSLWLDADDGTTVTIGTGVSEWRDKSGNARHVAQATAVSQPSYVTGARNGRAVVRFDGTQFLSGGDVLDLGLDDFSAYAVFSNNAIGQRIISKWDNGIATPGAYTMSTYDLFLRQSSNSRRAIVSATNNTWTMRGCNIDRDTQMIMYRPGIAATPLTTGFPDTTDWNTSLPFMVGGWLVSGVETGSLIGDIGEIVVSLATWTTEEREKCEGYLAHKWGIRTSLPNDHPYRYIVP